MLAGEVGGRTLFTSPLEGEVGAAQQRR
ncbi:MAG: hypothetical protein QOD11_2995, partial [Bradyrhizobium sp.]|nr:hypothetical protein [Bradyrhizobium sp.]